MPATGNAGQDGPFRGPSRVPICLEVNGIEHNLAVEPRRTLLEALRLDLQMTGTKLVCARGECGACTVIVDGRAVYACLTLAIEGEGREIRTIEGLAQAGKLHTVQETFLECDAYQCGFCTPGQIMSVVALLETDPSPSLEEIKTAVSGNLCRCAAYPHIVAAAAEAVRRLGPA